MENSLFLGIDIGTSGIRASCIDAEKNELSNHQIGFHRAAVDDKAAAGKSEQDPEQWRLLLDELLCSIREKLFALNSSHRITAITIDGTSSTVLACSQDGTALSPALMYNDSRCHKQAEMISRFAPSESAVHGTSSSLAKALYLLDTYPQTERLCHQADWLSASLTGKFGISDENNCLKLGYDSINQQWPEWLLRNSENAVIAEAMLPNVVTPGTAVAKVLPELVARYQLAHGCIVVAGTTDSNAAVLATGASQTGDAVTSLGSSLVIKLFSNKPIFNPDYGIYSHRLNNSWLVGGASNSGGAVLLKYFTQQQIDEMTPLLTPEQPTGLDYYPLPDTGERFPVNDSNKQCRITPRPDSDIIFFQGLLEGIASIEAEGYDKLASLGATPVKRIYTAGGGSNNLAWKIIRERTIGTTILSAENSDACYGSALLARQGFLAI
ncbi:MAG: FGGY-family carbohydrate kinase [Gammaproteobacteria bacterium]|nr:FGGY-family carbohydrate kinase [Gammaproteobacteria bacterium]MBT8133871.1 FGGY-family carbohydrate kinase [Gammaproteobacteria bacterium]NNJ49700.1 FGGY-family carbohydrate kinase [Gammaproteobacteria bacterium]